MTDRDDGHHEHGSTPGWSERLTFTFFDEAAGFGGIARLVFRPLERAADGTINLFVPNQAVATVLAKGAWEGAGRTQVGRIRFERHDAMGTWHIGCKDVALVFPKVGPRGLPKSGRRTGAASPVEMDLSFEPWSEPAGHVERSKHIDEMGFVQVTSAGRFEQPGRMSGRIRVAALQGSIDGTAVRARAWGLGPSPSRWITVAFDQGLSLGVRWVSFGDRREQAGWVARAGEVRAVRGFHLETDYEGRALAALRLALTDETGERHAVTGETVATMPVTDGTQRARQAMMAFECEGKRAQGLIEYADDV